MDRMSPTLSLKVFNYLYLSSESLLNVGCFMTGSPILGPAMPCGYSAAASAKAWMANLVASATAFVWLCS